MEALRHLCLFHGVHLLFAFVIKDPNVVTNSNYCGSNSFGQTLCSHFCIHFIHHCARELDDVVCALCPPAAVTGRGEGHAEIGGSDCHYKSGRPDHGRKPLWSFEASAHIGGIFGGPVQSTRPEIAQEVAQFDGLQEKRINVTSMVR